MIMSVTEARVNESSEKLGSGYFDGLKPGDVREISSDKLFFVSKGDRVTHDTTRLLGDVAINDEYWSVGFIALDEGKSLYVRGVELGDGTGERCYLIHEQHLNRHDRALSERLYVVGLKAQTE